jgi:oligopeptide transport system substrate-binding protein
MGPFADNLPLRQSIAMAIDRKLLSRSLAFGQVGAYGFVPPGTSNYIPQAWQWRDLGDPERINEARRLYAKAGYSKESPLHIRLLFNSNPLIKNTAIVIAQMWKETLGIETSLTDEEYRVFLQSRHDRSRWDVVRLGWTADYDDASNFLDIFRQYSTNNDTGYSSPSFDGLLNEAAQQSDPLRRSQILETAERKMLADYPVLPLYYYVSKRLVKPYIRGAQVNSLNRLPSKSLRFADR